MTKQGNDKLRYVSAADKILVQQAEDLIEAHLGPVANQEEEAVALNQPVIEFETGPGEELKLTLGELRQLVELARERVDGRVSLMEQPPSAKAFVVFPGRPSIWYVHEGPGDMAYDLASNEARRLAEENQSDHTYMVVPRDSLDCAMVARYHGVVVHSLEEIIKTEEER